MAYQLAGNSSSRDAGLGSFGCGGACKCRGCSSRSQDLSEVYERDDDDTGVKGYGADVEVTEPAGRVCRVAERRIHPIVEPPPHLLVKVPPILAAGGRRGIRLHHACFAAFQNLKRAAEADGIPASLLTVVSGYRSVARQTELWKAAKVKYGSPEAARIWVAPPGGSAHHTGRAIDFNLGKPVAKGSVGALRLTSVYRWLVCNAVRFGFTPYAVEPWHWEFNPPGFNPAAPPPGSA